MKANIHPTYYSEANVVCVCGNKFTVGSTTEKINIELCNKCHPFYTGEQKFVDTASRIQKFETKQKTAKKYADISVQKKQAKEKKTEAPKTLREMLKAFK